MSSLDKQPAAITKKPKTEMPPEHILSMYEIPGQDSITPKTYARYLKDKEVNDIAIKEAASHSILHYRKKIEDAATPNNKKVELIKEGLRSNNQQLQETCADAILYVSDESKFKLIEEGINTNNRKVQIICSELIWPLPEHEKFLLIEKGLESSDPEVRKEWAQKINLVQEKKTMLERKIAQIAWKGLTEGDLETQKNSAAMISNIPFVGRDIFSEKIANIVEEGLKSKNPETEKVYAWMIRFASRDKIAELIKLGLETDNIEAQSFCAEAAVLIAYDASINTRLEMQEKLIRRIKEGLSSSDPEIQKAYTKIISCVYPDYIQAELLREVLVSKNKEVQKVCLKIIREDIFGSERQGLIALAREHMGDSFIEPPLYDNSNSLENFKRVQFPKDGSETILLGGELKDKVILRRVDPEAFLTWQMLYENYQLWQNVGFDYVPIEPICSFKFNQDGLVDAYSGVLDINLATWVSMTDEFLEELFQDRDRIKKALEDNGLIHGHSHESNFCLRFFRAQDGKVDFTKKPRLYLIDFDQAVSPAK